MIRDHENAPAKRTGSALAVKALALAMLGWAGLASAPALAQQAGQVRDMAPLTETDTIGDVLDHPAFDGFAELTLPWFGRDYDRTMPLTQMQRLLPYHSEVHTPTVVAGLNRIISDQAAGRPVFHYIYTEDERRADPGLAAAGLFFFAGRPGAPFAVIAPGGGFSYVGSVHEGFPYAVDIADAGYNAFVVTYRTGRGGRPATRDMARAIDYIKDHAADLQVDPEGYSTWGSSAGARMAAYIGSDAPAGFGGRSTDRSAAVIMAYTAHAPSNDSEPPTYVVVGERDGIAPPRSMEPRVAALRRAGVEVSYNVIPGIGHGFGNGAGTQAEGWVDDAIAFWVDHLP